MTPATTYACNSSFERKRPRHFAKTTASPLTDRLPMRYDRKKNHATLWRTAAPYQRAHTFINLSSYGPSRLFPIPSA